MKLTPSSTARRSTRMHSSWSSGGPQTPFPVIRMAPKPSRLTVTSPPRVKVPDAWSADEVVTPQTVRPVMTWCQGEIGRLGGPGVDVPRGRRDGGPAARRVPPRTEVSRHRPWPPAVRGGGGQGDAVGNAARGGRAGRREQRGGRRRLRGP